MDCLTIIKKTYHKFELYLIVGPHHLKDNFGKTLNRINKFFLKKFIIVKQK